MIKSCIFIITAAMLLGCMKIPKEVFSPGIKIDYSIAGNKEVYTINFSGVIRNENVNTAMKNVNGSIGILDPDSKVILISIPFSFDVILPMSFGTLDLKTDKNETETAALLHYFNIDHDELVKNGSTDGQFLSEEQVIIEKIVFEKQDIIDLLQEKI
jgi:hypothetical protein